MIEQRKCRSIPKNLGNKQYILVRKDIGGANLEENKNTDEKNQKGGNLSKSPKKPQKDHEEEKSSNVHDIDF